MAISVKQAAKGDAAQTGAPGFTPAPKAKPQPPDAISQVRNPTPAGYGQNNFAGRSSLNPGEQLLSPMAASLKAAQDDGEGVLDTVIARGAKSAEGNFETRPEPVTPYPPAHGMRNRSGE
jgi:hypothetical protein